MSCFVAGIFLAHLGAKNPRSRPKRRKNRQKATAERPDFRGPATERLGYQLKDPTPRLVSKPKRLRGSVASLLRPPDALEMLKDDKDLQSRIGAPISYLH